MMIKAYIDKKFAKFSLIWPSSTKATNFEYISSAHNEPEKVVSIWLIEE
jgi:hypothetical protein